MKTTIKKSDFSFQFNGHGHYKVTYTSPITKKNWTAIVDDMTIIDNTKNSDDPKKVQLNELKKLCKNNTQ